MVTLKSFIGDPNVPKKILALIKEKVLSLVFKIRKIKNLSCNVAFLII
jgi:hypothetical protein